MLAFPVIVIAHLVVWWAVLKSFDWGETLLSWALVGLALIFFIWSIAEGADLATAHLRKSKEPDD